MLIAGLAYSESKSENAKYTSASRVQETSAAVTQERNRGYLHLIYTAFVWMPNTALSRRTHLYFIRVYIHFLVQISM